MKLLSQVEAKKQIRKDNEELLDVNLRLRKGVRSIISRLNSAKSDYSNEKVRALKEFDEFVEILNQKKSKLLKEYKDLEEQIEKKKEIYYGLIEKQDILEEKIYELNERESKLDYREDFIKALEKKHGL